MKLLGVTGLFASGKDTVADYLVKKGFDHFSLSAILREEAVKRGIETNRENLIKLGTQLKEEKGYDVLAKRALQRVKKDTVISSVRHPKEVEYFKRNANFSLIEIFADSKTRYERMVKRARENDAKQNFEEFLQKENIERNPGGGQEFDNVIKLADYRINNNNDFKNLYRQIDELLTKILEENGKKN